MCVSAESRVPLPFYTTAPTPSTSLPPLLLLLLPNPPSLSPFSRPLSLSHALTCVRVVLLLFLSPSHSLFPSRGSIRHSISTVSLNRRHQHPPIGTGEPPPPPPPTNLRPLRSNVYVSPASIILTQPPINRIQARRIAEYRWDTYVRQAGRQTGLGLGSGSSSVYVHLRNTAW